MKRLHPLEAYRKKHGMSRQELASMIGVEMPTVWRWEHGTRKVDDGLLRRVAAITGIDICELRPDLAALMRA